MVFDFINLSLSLCKKFDYIVKKFLLLITFLHILVINFEWELCSESMQANIHGFS